MATKKERRAAALAKHEERMGQLRETGMKAQKMDRDNRARAERQEWQDQHDKKHSWTKRIKECPHCSDEIAVANKARKEAEDASNQASSADISA